MTIGTGKYQALLVTSDKSLPKLLAAIFLPAGIGLTIAAHREFAAIVREQDFAIIVVDGDLPFRLEADETVVVVLSPCDAVANYDRGADLVVDRPLATNIFLAKLRSVMRRYGEKL